MAANPDVRWRQRLQSFRKAFDLLSNAAAVAGQPATLGKDDATPDDLSP